MRGRYGTDQFNRFLLFCSIGCLLVSLFVRVRYVNTVFWVPSALANLSSSGALENAVPDLRNIFFCGEVMHCSTLNEWKRHLPKAHYVNMYGPTEITDVCAYYIIDREFADTDSLPIGHACSNSWVGLIDGRSASAEPACHPAITMRRRRRRKYLFRIP